MTTPSLDSLLEATRTDPDIAEGALDRMYGEAGLGSPEFIWTLSPRAGFERVREELDARQATIRRVAVERLMAGRGEQVCLCPWCRGVSVSRLIHGTPLTPDLRLDERTPQRRRDGGLVFAALERDVVGGLGEMPRPRMFRNRVNEMLGVPFGNPWLTAGIADCYRPDQLGRRGVSEPWLALGCSAGWWWPYYGFVVLSARPERLAYDLERRLHCEAGPAVVYPDGWSVNALENVLLPVGFFEEVTFRQIADEQNLEVRRMMISRYGPVRFVDEAGGQLVAEDEWGQLWVTGQRTRGGGIAHRGRDSMTLVRVVDATPQPDGIHRVYWLHVPPAMRTAREAVAWTFGLQPDEYQPKIET